MFQSKLSQKSLHRLANSDIDTLAPCQFMQMVSDVESLLDLHSIFIDENDDDIGLMFEAYDGPEAVISNLSSLKAQGNHFFNKQSFESALLIYQKTIKYLCVTTPMLCESIKSCDSFPDCKEIVISLHLNMAACELKLLNFENVVHFCSLVLRIDHNNVKARFRRGSAFIKLGVLDRAMMDLNKALAVEPNNKAIQVEISKLEGSMSSVSTVIRISEEMGEKYHEAVVLGDLNAGFSQFKSEENDWIKSNRVDEQVKGEESCLSHIVDDVNHVDEGMSGEIYPTHEVHNDTCTSAEEGIVKKDSVTNMEVDQMENPTVSSKPNQSSPLRRKVTYRNKKNPTSFLKLSVEDVKRLRNGKSLVFYNSHSMSFLKVQTFTSKKQIQIETPHNSHLREAVVSKCEVTRSGTEGPKELSGLRKDSKGKPTNEDKEGSKASNNDIILSDVKIKDVECEGSGGGQCWQKVDQHITPHQDSFHPGTSSEKMDNAPSVEKVDNAPSVEKVDNDLSVELNHCSSFKMNNDSAFQPLDRWAKVKPNQSGKSKVARKCRMKPKSTSSKAAPRAKQKALRNARHIVEATQVQKLGQQKGRSCSNLINCKNMGVKRDPLPLQADDFQIRKKMCNQYPFPKFNVAHQCKCFSFSCFNVGITSSFKPKPARSDVVQASL